MHLTNNKDWTARHRQREYTNTQSVAAGWLHVYSEEQRGESRRAEGRRVRRRLLIGEQASSIAESSSEGVRQKSVQKARLQADKKCALCKAGIILLKYKSIDP
ncbi:hypothetical protein TNCV_4653751 [Trichonephila clavipes]|nr:hypothetical protein TNCV_4653751 [Trichonephila clavipes]